MMIHLGLAAIPTGYTGVVSADNTREIPPWCGWVPFADYMETCQPYTQMELDRITRSQAEYAANSPSSAIPVGERPAYVEQAVTAGAAVQAAGERSDPLGACEYRSSQAHSLGMKLLGGGMYCNPDGSPTGFDLTYAVVAVGGVLALLLLKR